MNKEVSMEERRQIIETVRGLICHLNREEVNAIALVLNSCCERLLNESCKELGMDLDEVIRLKQITGLKEAFQNHDFSKSWEEFESKYYSKEE